MEAPIVRALRSAGCLVEVMLEAAWDLTVLAPDGIVWLVEVKTPRTDGGRGEALTEREQKFHDLWGPRCPTVRVVRSVDQALECVGMAMCARCSQPRYRFMVENVGGEGICTKCRRPPPHYEDN